MPRYTLADLIELMARLRDPLDGCPWDLKQNFSSITKHTLEEVYEVIDAIEREDLPQLRDELGDLLFQIVFYAQLAREQAAFDLADVVDGITQKLLRRHPHVFPDGTLKSRRQGAELTDAAIKAQWEQLKSQERSEKGQGQILADIPVALPGLLRAEKLQKRVAALGMDFVDAKAAIAGLKAEINELEAALASEQSAAVADELGDVLFSLVNVARHVKLDAEQCLRAANSKFSRRVIAMDKIINERQTQWADCDADAYAALWQQAKGECN
ncbi:MAG: nucleoside triphosphate pyrophosphohydrolase [Marinagarivorans sp.]